MRPQRAVMDGLAMRPVAIGERGWEDEELGGRKRSVEESPGRT